MIFTGGGSDTDHLTKDELKGILSHVKKAWQRLMLIVAYNHGLRVSEVLSLTPANCKSGYLTVKRLKGSDKTIQKFVDHPDPELNEKAALEALCETKGYHEKLFPMTRFGVYKLIERAGTKAGVPAHKLHPHVLKHTAAMHMIKKAGIEMVRRRLGHKSIASTGAYLKVSDSEADAAYEKAIA